MTDHCFNRAAASEFGLGFTFAVSRRMFSGHIGYLNFCPADIAFATKTTITIRANGPFTSYCFHLFKEWGETVAIVLIESVLSSDNDPVSEGLGECDLVAKFILFMLFPLSDAKNFRLVQTVNLVLVSAFLVSKGIKYFFQLSKITNFIITL